MTNRSAFDEIDRLRAENERLRVVLREWIAAAEDSQDPYDGNDVRAMLRYGAAFDAACAALKETP